MSPQSQKLFLFHSESELKICPCLAYYSCQESDAQKPEYGSSNITLLSSKTSKTRLNYGNWGKLYRKRLRGKLNTKLQAVAVSRGMPEGEAAVGSIKSGGHAQPLTLEARGKSLSHYHALQCSCSVFPLFFK